MCGETLLTLPHDVQGKCCQLLQLWRDGTLEFLAVPAQFPSTAACQVCPGAWEGQQPLSWQCCSGGSSILGSEGGDRWQPVPPATFPVGVFSPVISDPEEPS